MTSSRRLQVLSQQLCAASLSREERAERGKKFMDVSMKYMQSVQELKENGTPPEICAWDVVVVQRQNQTRESVRPKVIETALDEADQSNSLTIVDLLPGPLKDVKTKDERIDVINEVLTAQGQGRDVQKFAEFQQKYGDRGLSTNIVVPDLNVRGGGFGNSALTYRVIVADPEDSERIARVHTRKDGSFEPALFDSIISTQDNTHWQEQRKHFSEVFMPLSSLAKILPVSLERAKFCADKLAGAANSGTSVDMSEFLLHEAQAQLQLALLGLDEDFMEKTNKDIRRTFGMHPEASPGSLGSAMAGVMRNAKENGTLGLPSDGNPVRGPLSRAIQQSPFDPSTDYGNALLILFAGHDTTGHAMTWLLFELARHPEYQEELQRELDGFFQKLDGRNPGYEDFAHLPFFDRCITETLRLWTSVPNGTFRQLQFDDEIKGEGGKLVTLPKGTHCQIMTWSRHRNPDLWGQDVDEFNPHREFAQEEIMRVGSAGAAQSPQSQRFSPFAHKPRTCLGRNFAQLEMRLIIAYLLRSYRFSLAPPYDHLQGKRFGSTVNDASEFRGVNNGTMGPMNLHDPVQMPFGQLYTVGLKLSVHNRVAK